MARVEFQAVGKSFEAGAVALADFTLAVDDGELLVLVGPSGCGKSTVLRLLAGLETVTSGTIRIGDQRVNDLSPQERNVAMVFQDYALYPFMRVRENLEFPLKMRKLSAAERAQKVEATAKLLDLESLLDRLPRQLSGGQRQRVAMGRALVREPAVSLLDEPLSNLDAKLRVQVRAEIAELQRRTATTMIYVTHDQVEAMTLGHRVAVLDHGRLQQVASPGELYAQPANVFVAGFIGNPPMNLIAAQVESAPGGQGCRIGRSWIPLPLALAALVPSVSNITLGIRPEALSIGEQQPVTLDVQVRYLEYLGHETLVYADVGESTTVIARLPGMPRVSPGEPLSLCLDPARITWFSDDGTRIPLGVGP